MERDIQHYLNLFQNLGNPIYNAIIFIILIFSVLLLVYKNFIVPSKRLHIKEKKELKDENLKMLHIFAEYDPNPIIHIDENGEIKNLNRSALQLFHLNKNDKQNINDIIPNLVIDYQKEIHNNSSLQINVSHQKKYFSVNFYGIQSLKMAQIYFLDMTERSIQEKEVQDSERKFKSLANYLQDYLEAERQRISLELHDVIGQNLFLLKLTFDEASENYEKFKDNHTNITNSLNSTITELRNIMFDLRPKNLEDFGLHFAIKKLSEHISSSSKQDGKVEIIGETRRINAEVELYLFRIVQECLSNIIKHSQATEYKIQLLYSEKQLQIYISDNGIGFETEKIDNTKSFGLLNISERIKALNGEMKINSSSEGTLLLLKIPV